jgi:hypothetical protein
VKKGICIHYSGAFDRLLCKADVSYLDLVEGESSGWMLRLPCLERNNSPLVCEKRQFPTDEEIQKWDDDIRRGQGHQRRDTSLCRDNALPEMRKDDPLESISPQPPSSVQV